MDASHSFLKHIMKLKGNENFKKVLNCFVNILFGFFSNGICQNVTNHLCGMVLDIVNKPVLRKNFSQYEDETIELQLEDFVVNGTTSVFFNLRFIPDLVVHEEVYLIDIYGLIGSVGGSLGLFIGFSFFQYIVDGCDYIFDVIC